MAIWCGFRGFYIGVAFCPSVFELSPFWFRFASLFGGCLSLGEVVGGDFEAYFVSIFIFVLILGEADFVDLEVPIYFLQCAFFNGVDFVDPEARFWSLFGWPLLGRAGLVDFEVLNYFLQCASSGRVDLVDSEAPILQCVLLLVKPISLAWRHDFDPFLGDLF